MAQALTRLRIMSNSKMKLTPERIDFQKLRPSGKAPVKIQKVELRGITVTQLMTLGAFLSEQAGEDKVLTGWHSERDETKTLNVDTINLYDLTFWVINPMTFASKCSYVEAVCITMDNQKPVWFVSHWWGS